jgi:16S rRNA (guanine1516-N2)-methyltransferase
MAEISVIAINEEESSYGIELAQRWGFDYQPDIATPYQLQWTGECLQLISTDDRDMGIVLVDFVTGAVEHRRKYGGGKGQPIAKAVGIKTDFLPKVLDATAGFGRDGYLLASLGCQVMMLEREPVMAALLQDGLRRARYSESIAATVVNHITFNAVDSIQWLKHPPPECSPDVVYLDPMFPHKNKTARVKKEMFFLQQLLGEGQDGEELLHAALKVARKRVVVKRPKGAPTLNNLMPDIVFATKKNRFDVYLTINHS